MNIFQAALNSMVFAFIGMFVFGIGFYIFDRITPGHLWKEVVEKQNVAISILVGSFAIALALIISAAVHG